MTSLATALKEEIRTLARREIRRLTAPADKAMAQCAREIAALKRQIQELQREFSSLNTQPIAPTTVKKQSSRHVLKPDETVQKVFFSTTSRLIGEYQGDGIIITHAWPSVYDSSANMRMLPNPISRSGYIVAFNTPPIEKASGIVVPDYTPFGELICSYCSVLFGKRFDCHGLVEGGGMYRIPDVTAYSSVCNPNLPFNSHVARKSNPIPLNLGQLVSIEPVIFSTTIDSTLQTKLNAACTFYMQALTSAEKNVEVAYLHLITAGELISSFFEFKQEEILDHVANTDLLTIRENIENGAQIANRLSSRLTSIKRTFVRSLNSLLDDEFFLTSESDLEFSQFKQEDIEKRIGAAYDLRSQYVHTGVPFGQWVEPSGYLEDIQLGKPIVEDRGFGKTLAIAPKFIGLERLIRHCLLKFMQSRGLFLYDQSEYRRGD